MNDQTVNQAEEKKILAGSLRRIFAFLIDIVLLSLFGFLLGLVCFDFLVRLGLWGRLLGFFICIIYFSILGSSIADGQTIGNRVAKIKIVGRDGKCISFARALVSYSILLGPFFLSAAGQYLLTQGTYTRLFGLFIYFIILYFAAAILYLLIFNRRSGQLLHNLITGTFVIKSKVTECQPLPRIWKFHLIPLILWFVTCGVCFLAAGGFVIYSAKKIEPFNEFSKINKNVLRWGLIKNSKVYWENLSLADQQQLCLVVDTSLKNKVKDLEGTAAGVASIVMYNNFELMSKNNFLAVMLKYGYDIGIARSFKTYMAADDLVGWVNKLPSVPSERAKNMSVFNNTQPDPLIAMDSDDMKKNWFLAPATQKMGMFSPVFLPFDYEVKAGVEDKKQPLTFPCLLAFKFDFVPDNYSARHPAFIYRKRPLWNVRPGDTEQIADYISCWDATHAIGGKIVQDVNGYTGQMLVFDGYGLEILRRDYNEPVPYFTLMGQMVKTWMDYRNQQVSDGLYQELIRPMTNNMQCVGQFGDTFDVEWRSDKEWQIYDSILAGDPNFAEVRFWYANQKLWEKGDAERTQLQIEKGKALQSHLVMSALSEFDFKNCPDKKVVEDFYKALSYAEEICGEHNVVLQIQLEAEGNNLSMEQLDKFLAKAQRYPSSCNLIDNLASEYRSRGCYEKSMPLLLSAVNSGYLKGVGRFDWEWYLLAQDFYELGYPDESIACGLSALRDCSDERKGFIYWYLGEAFQDKKCFTLAATLFAQRQSLKLDSWGGLWGYLCHYQAGNTDSLELWDKASVTKNMKPCFAALKMAREYLAKGSFSQAIDELEANAVGLNCNGQDFLLEKEITQSDIYSLSGDAEKAKEHAINAWYIAPRNRRVACLLERTMDSNLLDLSRYAKTGVFIFNNDQYWKSLLDRVEEKTPPEESKDEVLAGLRRIKNELAAVSKQDEPKFWRQFSPFTIEYISMYLLRTTDQSLRDEALNFYLRYSSSAAKISDCQKMHTRIFFVQLLNLISKSDRQPWLDIINKTSPSD